jgi:membrane dipeptidase
MPLLIDSHLDLAWNALSWKRDLLLPLPELNRIDADQDPHPARGHATVSLPELRRGQVAVCLATLMGRVPYGETINVHGNSLDFPRHENVFAFAQGQLAYYRILELRGEVRWLRDRHQLQQHWQAWQTAGDRAAQPIGIIIAMEGSDAICEPEQAELWYQDGLRCASLVHYGSSRYASGTGDDGPLTACGRKLLDEFARLGIILDVTHLCDQSFFEAIDHFAGPVLASHQNCRALVPGQRQFSDEQLRRVLDRDGVIGIAFDAWMMYPGWERGKTSREVVAIGAAVDHVDHLCQLAGNDRQVAIGSDLDGGFGTEQSPTGLDSIADLQRLAPLLSQRGYSDESIARIFGGNWLRFFSEHLPGGTA